MSPSERNSMKEEVDKSLYRQALTGPSRVLHYTASAPPTPMYEMRSLPRNSTRFERNSSSPSRSEGSSDTSSSDSLCNTLPKMSNRSRKNGNSSPTQVVQLSPISYLIEDAEIYEYNTQIDCDTTILETGEDNPADSHDVKIYLSPPEESTTDDISETEIHDTSLDSADIYGLDSESDSETVDLHEIQVECYTPEVKSIQSGPEIVQLQTILPKMEELQESDLDSVDSVVVNKSVDINLPKHKEKLNSENILHQETDKNVNVEVIDSSEWIESSGNDNRIRDTYVTPVKRIIKSYLQENKDQASIKHHKDTVVEDVYVTPIKRVEINETNPVTIQEKPEICPDCAKLQQKANNPPGFYTMGKVLGIKDMKIDSPLSHLFCAKCGEIFSWAPVARAELSANKDDVPELSEEERLELFGNIEEDIPCDKEEMESTVMKEHLKEFKRLPLSDHKDSHFENQPDYIRTGIVKQIIQNIEQEKFSVLDSEDLNKSSSVAEYMDGNNSSSGDIDNQGCKSVEKTCVNNNVKADDSERSLTLKVKATSPSPEEMARAAILESLSSRGREIWEHTTNVTIQSDDHKLDKAQMHVSCENEQTKL